MLCTSSAPLGKELHCLTKSLHSYFLFAEPLLQTSTDPGFSMRRTVSSVIGSISGLIFPVKSSDPFTCSRLIFTSATARAIIEGNEIALEYLDLHQARKTFFVSNTNG